MTAGNNKTISISKHFANTSSRTRENHVRDGSWPFLTFSLYSRFSCWIRQLYLLDIQYLLRPIRKYFTQPTWWTTETHWFVTTLFSRDSIASSRCFRSFSLLPMDSFYLTLDVHPVLHSLRTLACSIDQDRFRYCESCQNFAQYGTTQSWYPRSNVKIHR